MNTIKQYLASCTDKLGLIKEDYDRPIVWEYAIEKIVSSCMLWILMLAAAMWMVYSFFADLIFLDGQLTWFQRSGSVLVATSVLVLSNARLSWENRVMYQQFLDKMNVNISFEEFDPNSKTFYRLSRFAIVVSNWSLIIGTLSWGYGDLFVN